MNILLAERIKALWHTLKDERQWKLVSELDEGVFLQQILAELSEGYDVQQDVTIRTYLYARYFEIMYYHLLQSSETAAEELWIQCLYSAKRRGIPHSQIEDVASETVYQIIKALPSVKMPRTFLKYVLSSSVRHCINPNMRVIESLDNEFISIPDNQDLEQEAEIKDLLQRLQELIDTHIENSMQHLVLSRVLCKDDRIEDIAQDLSVPSVKLRIAKMRGLNRLKKIPAFNQLFASFRDQY